MRGANRAAGDQIPILARHGDLSGLAAHLMNAVIERRIAAFQRIHRHGAGDDRRGKHVLRAEQPRQGQCGGYLRPVDQRQAFLGAQFGGLEAGKPQAIGCRQYLAAYAHVSYPQ